MPGPESDKRGKTNFHPAALRPALPRAHPIRSGAGLSAKGEDDEGKHEGQTSGEVREVLENGIRRAEGREDAGPQVAGRG